MKKILTLCLVYNDTHLLLGYKKRGFGAGRWNGFGGKVDQGESIQEAAQRELEEEAGIVPKNLKERGVINFEFENDPELLEVHFFSTSEFGGEPVETSEMKPRWFKFKSIPYREMWPDDKHWLPLLLKGKNFRGKFYFKDLNIILNHEIKVI